MSFLDTVRKAGFAGFRYAAPLLSELSTGYVKDPIASIGGLVLTAENVSQQLESQGGTRMDKLKAVLPEAAAAVIASPIMQNKVVTDTKSFQESVTMIVNGIVGLLKAVDLPGTVHRSQTDPQQAHQAQPPTGQ
jgi:hypothetical protein